MKLRAVLLLAAAVFLPAVSPQASPVCQGKVINPVTDVCWRCVFPVKIGGRASI